MNTLSLGSKRTGTLILAVVITFLYPEIGSRIAFMYSGWFDIKWLYIHHLVQMALAFITISLFILFSKNQSFTDWGFNLNRWKWSVRAALVFAAIWFIISLVINIIFTTPSVINYNLTASNIISDLFFDFVVTGFSEEILFRGLIMGLLLKTWQGFLGTARSGISLAGVFAAVLFSLAHIGIDWQALEITYFNPLQLVFTMGLGLFYAFMMDKTNSLLGPVIAHGASDGLITVINLILLLKS